MMCLIRKENFAKKNYCRMNNLFKEHRKDFILGEGRSNSSTHVIEEGHEMKNIDNIMTILHKKNNHEKINKLGEKYRF